MGYWTTAKIIRGINFSVEEIKQLLLKHYKTKKQKEHVIEQCTAENLHDSDGKNVLEMIKICVNKKVGPEDSFFKTIKIYLDYDKGVDYRGFTGDEDMTIYICDFVKSFDNRDLVELPPMNSDIETFYEQLQRGLRVESELQQNPEFRIFHYYA